MPKLRPWNWSKAWQITPCFCHQQFKDSKSMQKTIAPGSVSVGSAVVYGVGFWTLINVTRWPYQLFLRVSEKLLHSVSGWSPKQSTFVVPLDSIHNSKKREPLRYSKYYNDCWYLVLWVGPANKAAIQIFINYFAANRDWALRAVKHM